MGSLLDTSAAASVLGLRESTLEKWRIIGRGPRFVKIGRTVRYNEDDLREFVCGHSVDPGRVATCTAV